MKPFSNDFFSKLHFYDIKNEMFGLARSTLLLHTLLFTSVKWYSRKHY